jgi:hypothetical protein
MKRMYPAVLLLVIVAASTVSVKSQQAWTPGPAPRNSVDQVMVLGHGTLSCGVWLNERRNRTPRADAMTTWANGFLTGLQTTSPRAIPSQQARDREGRDAWLDQYCQTHPLDTWSVAVLQLFFVLTKQ